MVSIFETGGFVLPETQNRVHDFCPKGVRNGSDGVLVSLCDGPRTHNQVTRILSDVSTCRDPRTLVRTDRTVTGGQGHVFV